MLFAWHRMLTGGRRDLKDIGRYRRGTLEPTQIVSGSVHAPGGGTFEAPAGRPMCRAKLSRFIDWFNRTAPDGAEALPALNPRRHSRTSILYASTPSRDGNGPAFGRGPSAEKVLAQRPRGDPTLTALAATILAKRRGPITRPLERGNNQHDLTGWLVLVWPP